MAEKFTQPALYEMDSKAPKLKTAVVGIGALGKVIGGLLTDSGVDVELIEKDPVKVAAMMANGIRITGTRQITVPKVNILSPEQMGQGYDIVILTTKAYDNEEAVPFIAPKLKEDGVIVTLQDGFPEKYISEVVGSNRAMGCAVEWGASQIGPDIAEITSDNRFLTLHVGRMPGISSGQLMNVRNLLGKAGVVHYEDNLRSARWSRLLVCCSLGAMNTINGGTFSHVFEGSWKVRGILLEAANECMRVGWASGADFDPVQGIDIVKCFHYRTFIKKWWAILSMPRILTNHRKPHSSMQTDVKRGGKSEVDYINGVVVQYGKKYGVPTPVNEKLQQMIHREMAGEMIFTKFNFDNF